MSSIEPPATRRNVAASGDGLALLLASGTCVCAIPVQYVVETMRPLPIEPVSGVAVCVRGVAVVRGVPMPVVDLRALRDDGACAESYGRFVTVRVGTRLAVLAVDHVIGIRQLDAQDLHDVPPLLRDARRDLVDAIGACDAQMLVVLQAMRIVPDDVWTTLKLSPSPQ